MKFQLTLAPSRLDAIASAITRVIEAIERRKVIEQQMETLVDQVTSTTRVVEDMMKSSFKGREDNARKAR
jgi:hypothetical protein